MDVVSLFSLVVFAIAATLFARTAVDDGLARVFFGTLMVMAAAVGVLGLLLRLLTGPLQPGR
jgi:hypothetical protein